MQLGYILKGLTTSLTHHPIEHINTGPYQKKAAVNTAEKHRIKVSHDSQVAYGICRQIIFLPWLPRMLTWSCNFSRRCAKLAVIFSAFDNLYFEQKSTGIINFVTSATKCSKQHLVICPAGMVAKASQWWVASLIVYKMNDNWDTWKKHWIKSK